MAARLENGMADHAMNRLKACNIAIYETASAEGWSRPIIIADDHAGCFANSP